MLASGLVEARGQTASEAKGWCLVLTWRVQMEATTAVGMQVRHGASWASAHTDDSEMKQSKSIVDGDSIHSSTMQ